MIWKKKVQFKNNSIHNGLRIQIINGRQNEVSNTYQYYIEIFTILINKYTHIFQT